MSPTTIHSSSYHQRATMHHIQIYVVRERERETFEDDDENKIFFFWNETVNGMY
jgi:hypothetical protein